MFNVAVKVLVESEDAPVTARRSSADEVINHTPRDPLGSTDITYVRGLFIVRCVQEDIRKGPKQFSESFELGCLSEST